MNLALFVSGGLGFKVLNHLKESKHSVQCVFTDSNSKEIIATANDEQLPIFKGNPRNDRALRFIDAYEIDIILSVNYLFLIERLLFSKAKLAINIHGSLLPKYRGRTPHVWAIINNETKTGVTAHLIDDGCDTGDIVKQKEVIIDNSDTGADILEKFNKLYVPLVDEILSDFERGRIKPLPQNNENATYFGKRTPHDGRINWGWQKERIRNWVRAQAYPYPGAFTFYEGLDEKVIIDEVVFSDRGFNEADRNGLIVSLNPICVKTPNGVLELRNIRNLESLSFLEVGQKLV
jgi:methionyl-tRNA formyltransferase